jgi:glycosyltransferase involved in cell wall biosynthesis
MRIAMLLESDGPGGAENVVLQLSEELRRRGHTVLHVGPEHGLGWLGNEFRARGIETHAISPRSRLDWGFVTRIRRFFRAQRVDVGHSHEFTMAVYGAVSARLEGVRHVITLHGGTRLTAARRRRLAVRLAVSLSAATVAVSEAWRRELAGALGVAVSRLQMIHNGVPSRSGDREATRNSLGIAPEELLILAVGNLEPWKGHRYLLEAVAGLPAHCRLVIAGGRGGSEAPALTELATALELGARFTVLLNRNDVPGLLAAADVFAMPSLFEGLPLALLEAMFAGRAIVASAVGGIPEAVTHGEQGLLVPPADAPGLREALAVLADNESMRHQLGLAAQARAATEFTIGAMADGYERLYRPG